MRVKSKVETVEEYLARGGSIKKLPAQVVEPQAEVIRKTTGGPVTIMTLDEADLFYGEGKPTKAKKKPSLKIDLSALPESLRKKFIAKLRDEDYDGEEENDEEDGDDTDGDED